MLFTATRAQMAPPHGYRQPSVSDSIWSSPGAYRRLFVGVKPLVQHQLVNRMYISWSSNWMLPTALINFLESENLAADDQCGECGWPPSSRWSLLQTRGRTFLPTGRTTTTEPCDGPSASTSPLQCSGLGLRPRCGCALPAGEFEL
jgi:hypothetical protein